MTNEQDHTDRSEELKNIELRLKEYADNLFREKYYGPIKDEVSSNMMGWLRSRYSILLLIVGALGLGGVTFIIDGLTQAKVDEVRDEVLKATSQAVADATTKSVKLDARIDVIKEEYDRIVDKSTALNSRIDEIKEAVANLSVLRAEIAEELTVANKTSDELGAKLRQANSLFNELQKKLDSSAKGIDELAAATGLLFENIVDNKIDESMAATTLSIENTIKKKISENEKVLDDLIAASSLDIQNRLQKN